MKQMHIVRVPLLAYGYQERDVSQQRKVCEAESFQSITCCLRHDRQGVHGSNKYSLINNVYSNKLNLMWRFI
jgi:hypothetical protein